MNWRPCDGFLEEFNPSYALLLKEMMLSKAD
jgi:hypothetical protein